MIDTDKILTDLYDLFVLAFETPPQIVNGEQDIPISALVYPRIVYRLINEYGDDIGYPVWQDIVVDNTGTDKDKFPKNVKRVFSKCVTFGVSIDGFGIKANKNKQCKPYLRRLREFLSLKELTNEFLDGKGYVISLVGSIDDRSLPVPSYEDRNGFDIVLQVEETIELVKPSIESVNFEYKED